MPVDADSQLAHLRDALDPISSATLPFDSERDARGKRQRHAAVAALLRTTDSGTLELLLIRRAERAGDVWSGHVALPGGRVELDDADLVATAVRETHEEIGVDLGSDACTLLGALPALLPRNPQVPPIAVQPFVWHVEGVDPATSDEVAAVAWVSVAHLASTEHRVEHRLTTPDGIERSFPAIHVGGAVPLWGMTHRIVDTLLDALEG